MDLSFGVSLGVFLVNLIIRAKYERKAILQLCPSGMWTSLFCFNGNSGA